MNNYVMDMNSFASVIQTRNHHNYCSSKSKNNKTNLDSTSHFVFREKGGGRFLLKKTLKNKDVKLVLNLIQDIAIQTQLYAFLA